MRAHRQLVALFILVLTGMVGPASAQEVRKAIDSTGRQAAIPQRISRVLAAGPPASTLLYTLAPEKMIGWVRMPTPAEKAFLAPAARDLPEYGRLTGRGGTANIENVLKFKPDLIIDSGSTNPTYVSLADYVQEQTKIPYLLLDGRFERIPEIYRQLGAWLGVEARAAELARYADETIGGLHGRIASIPAQERPRVYYARGANGLETRPAGSISMEVLERVGAVDVAAAGGIAKVSMEQVIGWDPDVILVLDAGFYRSVQTGPLWSGIKAVRNKRVFLAPSLPYGWLDTPPGVNRLMGARWLFAILYPDKFPESLRDTTRGFYKFFYQVDLTDEQLDTLLSSALPAKMEK